MNDHDKARREPLDPRATYYAVYRDESKRRVIGIRRRTPLEGSRSTLDEAFTRNLRWERTLFFIDPLFGKGMDRPYDEVGVEEAERIVDMLRDYWTRPQSADSPGSSDRDQ